VASSWPIVWHGICTIRVHPYVAKLFCFALFILKGLFRYSVALGWIPVLIVIYNNQGPPSVQPSPKSFKSSSPAVAVVPMHHKIIQHKNVYEGKLIGNFIIINWKSKIKFFVEILIKNPNFGQKSKFWSKIQILVKIQMLVKIANFRPRSKFHLNFN